MGRVEPSHITKQNSEKGKEQRSRIRTQLHMPGQGTGGWAVTVQPRRPLGSRLGSSVQGADESRLQL